MLPNTSAAAAAEAYGIEGISSWTDLSGVTSWPIEPSDKAKALEDAENMFTAIAEQWYSLRHPYFEETKVIPFSG